MYSSGRGDPRRFLGRVVRSVQNDAPILDEIADEYQGKLTVAKLTSIKTLALRRNMASVVSRLSAVQKR